MSDARSGASPSEPDRREIEALVFAYAERLDLGDFDGVGRLFEHAEYGPAGTPGLRGSSAVADVMRASVRTYEGIPRTKHVTTNVVVRALEASSAEASSYFTVFQQVGDGPLQPIVAGRYRDRFESVDGCWRFARREIWIDLKGDTSAHLTMDL